MQPTDVIRAIAAPLIELTLLIPLLLFWLLISFGVWAVTNSNMGMLIGGVLVLFMIIPPVFRFLTHVIEACANGKVPEAFDAEYFNWIGNMWSLHPLLLAIVISSAGSYAVGWWGEIGAWLVVLIAATVVPASLAVLAITHSVLQAFNPVALFHIYDRAGASFLIAPIYVFITLLIYMQLSLPVSIAILVGLFLAFSVAALTGALIAPSQLVEDVYIDERLEADEQQIAGDLMKLREGVLGHAWAFISRDNRRGGFEHIFCALEEDPDPVAAWDWYLGGMFKWDNPRHALFFGQHYIHDALRHGEDVRAVKVILRCRLVDAQFKPSREDMPAAIAAAEKTGNSELAEVLRRS